MQACSLRACRDVLATVLLLTAFCGFSQTRQIRLRNETIATPPKTNSLAKTKALSSQTTVSGLFLVQAEGHLEASAQAQLTAQGVELLKYIPDDAFIARFKNVSADKIRSLDFVRWVGAYRPDHKIHPRLAAAARAAAQTNQLVAVQILVSAGAAPEEIAAVRSLFTAVAGESRMRQGTYIRGILFPDRLDAVAQSEVVLWLDRTPKRKLVDELASKLVGGDDGLTGTPTVNQQLGFDGSGVNICVADTGLDTGDTNTMHPDLFGRVTGFIYYGSITNGSDGYGHGTHAAGIVAGNAATGETDPDTGALYGLGIASGATLLIERIFDDNAGMANPFPSDETLTRDAVRHGAKIGSNSWGNDVQGEYDADAAQFDELVRDADSATPGDQPYILEFSAGNAGPSAETIDSPASGKNVIATGASENVAGTLALTYGLYADGPDTMADFSSRGPCEDGRLKPDLIAPGTWIASLASAYADETAVAWSVIDDYYVYMGGTSMSGPYAAGAAAVFIQFYRTNHAGSTPSPALVKAALINSANELDELNGGPGPIPNNDEGWGRITLTNIITTNVAGASRYYQYVDQTVLLTTGQVYTNHVQVRSSGQPLKITLVYTDVPGFPGAIPALVNDLDLEVVAPDGTLYRGNQFVGSDSAPNSSSSDNLNNVEAVHLTQPIPGDYVVRVRARNVVQDARLDTATVDQDFALVISGDLARPGAGSILLNRSSYTAPDTIQLTAFDLNRAASNSVSVLVKSTTEPGGETYTLHASGNFGVFTGAVVTVVGSPVIDGKLEVHNGDTIEADYTDSSSVLRIATASVDLNPPAITGVTVTTNLGVITITWQTSELATSLIRYGTNLTFNLAATNTTLTTSHSVSLGKLVPGKVYSFYIIAADAAGNASTNNNSGAWFTFVGIPTPNVLLVDAYDPVSGSPVIDDGTYTNALAATGYTFAHWKVSMRGGPQLADLLPYPVVIWRVVDDQVNYGVLEDFFGLVSDPTATNNTLSVPQQNMLQAYLNQGGSFFMSSMGILSQLGDVPFRKNVLQVGGFLQNPNAPFPDPAYDEDHGVPEALGALGNPITSGVDITLNYDNYPSFDLSFGGLLGDSGGSGDLIGPDFSDTFTATANADTILVEADSGKACGISYPKMGADSPGRVAFLSFPIDTVPTNSEITLLRNILSFLTPGVNGAGTIRIDKSAYSAPDQVIIEVGDSDLIGAGQTQATFSTSSSTNQVIISMQETTRPGLFRGYLSLVATNAAQGQLKVKNGDTLTAKFYDASNHSNVVANAVIDTIPPVISEVSATAAFDNAVVTWRTSKPSDSLVQFGESVFLGRTAYDPAMVTNHSVTVSGVLANRTYLYEVTSRDSAGNATVDDNGQAFYSFSTGQTPALPFFDDFDHGNNGWKVVPFSDPLFGSSTELNWSLGTPSNSLQTNAYSNPNAWGTNLKSQPIGNFAGSALYSPVLDLSGYNQVTLTFWHCYDFSAGMLQDGQVCISTNSSMTPDQLPALTTYQGDTQFAWTQETVDLSAYIGQTIQVVWYYECWDSGTPPGWLIDDVNITGVLGGGTIVVTKNLSLGTVTINGPASAIGKGLSTTITNAPAGPYTVQFGDVSFFQTPPEQTGTLTNGGTLTFSGDYGFVDANHNGMSDAWEIYYFGLVTGSRTQSTDTDGDGMSDYAEFIAGTDPTNAASKLIILSQTPLTNGAVRLQWSAIPGRMYRLSSSSDLMNWSAVSDWMQATGSPMTSVVTNAGSGSRFFRVQVTIYPLPPGGSIAISKNLSQGSYTLSGPTNLTSSAFSTMLDDAPPGFYTLHFSDVPFYQTPADQSATLADGGSLTFTGNYTFTDANGNGISDAWETYYFGSVSTNRTQSSDTDHDGMSDYAEFIAGTNPTNAVSKFAFLSTTAQTNGAIQLTWSTASGRSYQLESSASLKIWTPLSDWLQATNTSLSYTVSSPANGQFYRVQVRP